MSRVNDAMLLRLAVENYTLRQAIFRDELKEIEMWSKAVGLRDMGFARQKTTYCYVAVASTLSLPSLSHVRLVLVKSAILVTVADDFFDKEGSSGELEALANAVGRWEHKGLNGHGKTIFNALKDLLDDISAQFFTKNGYHIKRNLQDLWHQTFVSWLKEAEWTRNGHEPSIVEYLQVATSSIASQTILLPAAFLFDPPPEMAILKCPQSEPLTNLLMLLTRLLNDIGSYQREQEEGKPNLVLLYMKENPKLGIEESIEAIKKIVEEKKKEFLEHALVNGMSGMPDPSKRLHLHCLKAFQMFYNSANAFDSPTELLSDINKAMYEPLRVSAPFDSFEINAAALKKKKKDKSFAGYGTLSHGSTSSKLSNGNSETACAIKIHGKVSNFFVAKPCFGVSSHEMRNRLFLVPFRIPKSHSCVI